MSYYLQLRQMTDASRWLHTTTLYFGENNSTGTISKKQKQTQLKNEFIKNYQRTYNGNMLSIIICDKYNTLKCSL